MLIHRVNQHLLACPNLALELSAADFSLKLHEPLLSLPFYFFRYRVGQGVGPCAIDIGVPEAANPVELCFTGKIEQLLEILFSLARETDDESTSQGEVRADLAPGFYAGQRVFRGRRPLHQLENFSAAVLEGDIQVRQQFSLGHEWNDLVDMRVGVNIVQPDPHAEFSQPFGQAFEITGHQPVAPEITAVLQIHAICGGILRYHQQFPDAGRNQLFSLAQNFARMAADQPPPHGGDNAEGAFMVAAFRYFQIGIVSRRQLDALWW